MSIDAEAIIRVDIIDRCRLYRVKKTFLFSAHKAYGIVRLSNVNEVCLSF